MVRKRDNIIYAMYFMVQIVVYNIGVSTRLLQSSLCERERERYMMAGVTRYQSEKYLQLATGIISRGT